MMRRAANPGHVPQGNAVEYYSQRARGCEGGLIITEATVVSETGHGYPCVPGIYTKEQIEGWKPITKEVKKHGATFFMQIWHVGRTSHNEFMPNKAPPLSSMATTATGDVYLPDGTPSKFTKPQALDKAGINNAINEYRQAARNAIDAGFDGVEIHGANGYLIDQFIKPKPNQRTDEYGGSIENRCRFALEIAAAVCKEVGAERVGIRLSPYGQFGDVDDDKPNETNIYLTEQLNKFGLAYIHFVEPRIAGNTDCDVRHESYNTEHFRKIWNSTFISAGGYNRERAIEAVQSNHTDLVCLGRHYLANPDLPRRWRENKPLNKYNRDLFYTQGNEGYLDYPWLNGHVPESAARFFA
ncbi:hypothetical protein WJX84_008064 [Apatococcus fuscideae]|uniref:NADH:flavin oxidoreductase/NADH oxidase N-terminal domain-containing protein n=1 Tax=Apatococcus fuscideae TaxID=2026836 RepID=A0AAW1SR36_9CHLO